MGWNKRRGWKIQENLIIGGVGINGGGGKRRQVENLLSLIYEIDGDGRMQMLKKSFIDH